METGKRKFYANLAVVLLIIVGIGAFGLYEGYKKTAQLQSIADVNWIIPLGAYDKVMPVKKTQELYVAKQGKKMALVTAKGQVTAFRYQKIEVAMESGLIAACAEGKYGYLGSDGREQLPFLYDAAGSFKGDYAAVKNGSVNKVIDRKGKTIYQTKKNGKLERTEKEGIFLFTEDEEDGPIQLIDVRSGKTLLPPETYIWADYSDGFWTLRDKTLNDNLMDENFKPLSIFDEEDDQSTNGFSEGLAGVGTVDGFCYVDKKGSTVIGPFLDEWGTSFHQDRACIWSDPGLTLINHKGNVIKKLPEAQDGPVLDDFSELDLPHYEDGLLPVSQNNYFGFLDIRGNWAVSPVFDKVSNFSEGRAAVVFFGNWGIIGKGDADVL